jgi:septum site-determining protein MinD
MSKIVSAHSFCGGTGKSNITVNLAALFYMGGTRAGMVDTNTQSPGIHVLFKRRLRCRPGEPGSLFIGL